jgi:hypothetical protein
MGGCKIVADGCTFLGPQTNATERGSVHGLSAFVTHFEGPFLCGSVFREDAGEFAPVVRSSAIPRLQWSYAGGVDLPGRRFSGELKSRSAARRCDQRADEGGLTDGSPSTARPVTVRKPAADGLICRFKSRTSCAAVDAWSGRRTAGLGSKPAGGRVHDPDVGRFVSKARTMAPIEVLTALRLRQPFGRKRDAIDPARTISRRADRFSKTLQVAGVVIVCCASRYAGGRRADSADARAAGLRLQPKAGRLPRRKMRSDRQTGTLRVC